MKSKQEARDLVAFGSSFVQVTINKNGTIRRRRIDPRDIHKTETDNLEPLVESDAELFKGGLIPVSPIGVIK